jgi:crossover junction endodeoxyribonuclease RusA
MTTALAFDLCPWCATPLIQSECRHPLPALGELEHHRIELPYPEYPRYPALSLNLRGNRWATNKDTQAVRADVARLARYIEPGKHLIVHLAWRPPKPGISRDEDNMVPLLKACCDGLARGPRRPTVRNPGVAIGLDLVPNDSRAYMTKLMPVILPDGPQGMWLTVLVAR